MCVCVCDELFFKIKNIINIFSCRFCWVRVACKLNSLFFVVFFYPTKSRYGIGVTHYDQIMLTNEITTHFLFLECWEIVETILDNFTGRRWI